MNAVLTELRILRANIKGWFYTLWLATYVGLPGALEERRRIAEQIRRRQAWEDAMRKEKNQ